MEPVMGCDPHLDSFTISVVDGVGRELAATRLANAVSGWSEAVRVAQEFGVTVVGIEGASGYGSCLARHITGAGIGVVDVPARVTAVGRRRESRGKSDPLDARVVARALLEGHGSGWVDHPHTEALRVVIHRRYGLIRDQIRDTNRLRALLADIDPERAAALGRLRSTAAFNTLTRVQYRGNPHRHTVAAVIRELAADCRRRLTQIRDLTRTATGLLPPAGEALIHQIPGMGPISAASLLAELAGSQGFTTHAKFARWAGAAPLDASSGRQQRHRLDRGGNRQANRILHTIIITQLRHNGPAAAYITRRQTEGKTKKEAIRAAKRHLARRIWKTLQQHQLT